MTLFFNTTAARRCAFVFLIIGTLVIQPFAQAAAPAIKPLSTIEGEISARVTVGTIKEITAALSSAEMLGRGTMQPGGDKAAKWIADRFQKLGLKPLGDKGSYLQKIDFKETLFTSEAMFKVGDESLKFGSDYAFIPYSKDDKSASGDLVFVAYGIQAAQIKRDDLRGVAIRGKVVVMLDGPPASISKEAWEKGNAKYVILGNIFREGAAAVVIIGHGREKDPPELIVDYLSRRQISLAGESEQSQPIPPIIMAGKAAAEKLFSKSGRPLEKLLQPRSKTVSSRSI